MSLIIYNYVAAPGISDFNSIMRVLAVFCLLAVLLRPEMPFIDQKSSENHKYIAAIRKITRKYKIERRRFRVPPDAVREKQQIRQSICYALCRCLLVNFGLLFT